LQGQIDELIANIKATPSLNDTAEIRIPSERAYAERARRLVEGITLPRMIVTRIEELDQR
jgi:LDH2 family malate/lactate/ureidoglycolate dehydrogenase